MRSLYPALLVVFCLDLSATMAQTPQPAAASEVAHSAVQVDCSTKQIPATISLDKKQMTIGLTQATAYAKNAIDAAQCEIGTSARRFLLTNVDLDLQTVTDSDGTLEVLFIGGLAGELDRTTTADTDFTYSVPTPGNYPREAHSEILDAIKAWFHPEKAPKPQNLAALITKAVTQLQDNAAMFPALSQHQVKVSLKFAFLKDATIEAEPKIGSVGVTAKWKYSNTYTQTITLTFADQTPTITLNVAASAKLPAGHYDLTATALPPSGFPGPVDGAITFLDGTTPLQSVTLKNGVASLPGTSLISGVHTLSAVYSGSLLDTAASSASIQIVP